MILVDTSVWIDFFRPTKTVAAAHLTELMSDHNRVCICGLIRQEILQGIHHPRELAETLQLLSLLPFLPTTVATYDRAAEIFRDTICAGTTIPTVDATIAAVAIEHDVSFFTLDRRHFPAMSRHSSLRLYVAHP